ncbi:MAG: class II aldolase/adducin family protein [Bdellovibrionaceae bacterium]|nr:class II aldolase/adducin family protein [Pseudobdellovibrionaceae bacterium]
METKLKNRTQIQTEILQICRHLHARNLLAAADGNLSYRMSDQEILITPTGVTKAFMTLEEVAVINLQGDVISGHPSSERLMHLEIFRRCPKAKAVIHAHPPTAIAWTLARPELKELPADSLPEVILAAGRIPIVPYARPGTQEMGDALGAYLPECRALIMARHGAVCWGEDFDEAYRGMERIEHASLILAKAVQLGGLSRLPLEEIEALYELRRKLGEKLL